ncbi:UbiA prenyltransferase family-domain-containing protein [Xylaria longipes]|nr:UbiA prenyltransferase family-domain-containing protein [Xylaria longipes]
MKSVIQSTYSFLLSEASITWNLLKSNIDGASIPFPIFTAASLLHKGALWYEIIVRLVYSLTYAFFYHYVFELTNQTARPAHRLEDKINKPDRPLVTNSMTLQSARIRYYLGLAVWLAYSYALGTQVWTLLWLATVFASWKYSIGLSDFGPTKDLSITIGMIAQLMAAWHIGGSDPNISWHWVKVIIMWMYPTIGIQDIRDVPGDLAVGRRTTVILLGDIPARIYHSVGLVIFGYIYIFQRVLDSRYDASTLTVSTAIAALTAGVIFRLFAWRSIESDRKTYRYYMGLYLLNLVAAGVCLRK